MENNPLLSNHIVMLFATKKKKIEIKMKVCQLIHYWNRWHWSSLLPEATITQTSLIFLWVKFPAPCNLKQLPSWLYLFAFTWTPLQQIPSCWPASTGMNRFSLDLWASGDNPWINLKSKGTDFFSSRFNSVSDAVYRDQQKCWKYRKKTTFYSLLVTTLLKVVQF